MDLHRIWCLGGCAFLLAGLMGFAAPEGGMTISTPAFAQGKPMPAQFAYKNKNISPEVRIGNVPAHARSLVLIVDDPDAPAGLWTHWLVWNLSPQTTSIPEGNVPPDAVQGRNSNGHVNYDGPAPPSGTHRFFFHLYALDTALTLPSSSGRSVLLAAMQGHIVGTSETYGVYAATP